MNIRKGSEKENSMGTDKQFRAIALDMDGTVLNDRKEIDEDTAGALREALAAGREVLFCSGRCFAEMRDFVAMFQGMHYLIEANGAIVRDLGTGEVLFERHIPQEAVRELQRIAGGRDILTQVFHRGNLYMPREDLKRLEDFGMKVYEPFFRVLVKAVDDPLVYALEQDFSIEKINFYHTSEEDRQQTFSRFLQAGVQIECVDAQAFSLEFSPPGIDKGTGLAQFSKVSGIPMEQIIMAGDSPNDLAAIEQAGLGVAMGNAGDAVKRAADVVTEDNNHAGCAGIIRKYLLNTEQ